MVAPVFLLSLLAEAMRHNVDLNALFRGLEIDAADFDMPGMFFSHREVITVVRRALRLLPIDELGLRLGQHVTITERGSLALGLLAAPTLGQAISLSVQFPRSAGYLMQIREDVFVERSDLVAEPNAGEHDLQRFLTDLTFSSLVQLRRQATSANYVPLEVEFMFEKPANADAYTAFFRCPVHFGCLRNALSTGRSWLDFRLPWANSMAFRLSSQLLEGESERLDSMPALGFTVERAIRRRLPLVDDLAELALSLNLSERTLRRQLALEGLSYRHLLDTSRKSRAFNLMSAGYRPIIEIATAVGFSDVRSFARAFKRWTGHSPSLITEFVAAARPEHVEDIS